MMSPNIIQVVPSEDFTVHVYFEDGRITCYDVSPMLDKGVFRHLKDKKIFMDQCKIINDTLAWDISGENDEKTCIDIDPETLYGSMIIDE